MQVAFPVNITSQGDIKHIGLSIQFDPAVISYQQSQGVAFMGPGVSGDFHAAFVDNRIGVVIDNASIPAGTTQLFYFLLEVEPGHTGLSAVSLVGSLQPFAAWSYTSPLVLDSNGGGLIDLAAGTAQAAQITVTGNAAPVAYAPPPANVTTPPSVGTPVTYPSPGTANAATTPNPAVQPSGTGVAVGQTAAPASEADDATIFGFSPLVIIGVVVGGFFLMQAGKN